MFNPHAISNIDPSTVEQHTTQYPWIQWGNGDPRQARNGGFAHTGGFFMPEKSLRVVESLNYRDVLASSGWIPETVYFGGGTVETPGWYKTDIEFCVIAKRRRWRAIAGRDTTYLPYSWPVWEQARKSGLYDRLGSSFMSGQMSTRMAAPAFQRSGKAQIPAASFCRRGVQLPWTKLPYRTRLSQQSKSTTVTEVPGFRNGLTRQRAYPRADPQSAMHLHRLLRSQYQDCTGKAQTHRWCRCTMKM